MTFSDQQVRKLKATLRPQHVREREIDGKTLHYVEGWHVVAEAIEFLASTAGIARPCRASASGKSRSTTALPPPT